uniref:Uncharacterized protein n=1 Tax=Gopherus evgoodei TaxID=1825980 RepID=A0A8C4Y0B0_9SAUR
HMGETHHLSMAPPPGQWCNILFGWALAKSFRQEPEKEGLTGWLSGLVWRFGTPVQRQYSSVPQLSVLRIPHHSLDDHLIGKVKDWLTCAECNPLPTRNDLVWRKFTLQGKHSPAVKLVGNFPSKCFYYGKFGFHKITIFPWKNRYVILNLNSWFVKRN